MISSRASMSLALAVVIGATILIGGCGAPQRPFDQELWKSGSPDFRASMVRDLLGYPSDTSLPELRNVKLTKDSILFQKSRDEIVELLGPPDGEGKLTKFMTYKLGYMRGKGFLVPSYALMFRFDDEWMPTKIGVGS